MLHIIFFILKILGLVLLVLIAAVLLILAAVLILPARYSARFSCGGTAESLEWKIRFHWLARLVSGEASYENGTSTWRFRAAWKSFKSSSQSGDGKAGEEKKRRKKKTEEKKREESGIEEKKIEEKAKEKKATQGEAAVERQKEEKTDSKPRKAQDKRTDQDAQAGEENEEKGFFEKLFAFTEKIKYTFRKICANIKSLGDKKDKVKVFLSDEIHKKAFFRALAEIKRLLRFLRPKRFEGSVEFGFEDPAHTGYVLAAVSMIYPLIGEYTDIRPDFEHKVFKGDVLAEGKIRLLYILIPAWNLYFDKNVKKTYKHIKNFKL